MAHLVKEQAPAEPDDLSLIPRFPMIEGRTDSPKLFFDLHTWAITLTHIDNETGKCNKKKIN